MYEFLNVDENDKQFFDKHTEVVELVESYLLTLVLQGVTFYAKVGTGGDYFKSSRYKYITIHARNQLGKVDKTSGFSISIYEDQRRATKAKFYFLLMNPVEFNPRKMSSKLRKIGITAWEKKKTKTGGHSYNILMYESPKQIKDILQLINEYLP
jgi:hypothetical protein